MQYVTFDGQNIPMQIFYYKATEFVLQICMIRLLNVDPFLVKAFRKWLVIIEEISTLEFYNYNIKMCQFLSGEVTTMLAVPWLNCIIPQLVSFAKWKETI